MDQPDTMVARLAGIVLLKRVPCKNFMQPSSTRVFSQYLTIQRRRSISLWIFSGDDNKFIHQLIRNAFGQYYCRGHVF
jgi:hypothetical protein